MNRKFLEYFRSIWKSYLLLFILFAWLQITSIMIKDILTQFAATYFEELAMYAIFYFSVMIFSLLAAIFSEKMPKESYLRIWVLTVIISCLVYLIKFNKEITGILYPLLGGASFGLGLPSIFSYFADQTSISNRGRAASLIFFLISLVFPLLVIINKFFSTDKFLLFFLVFLFFILYSVERSKESKRIENREVRYLQILTNKQFLFYFISWCMFCFINALEAPLLEDFLIKAFGNDFRDLILFLETIIASFSTLIIGFVIDSYGRRGALIYGFTTLGIAYAIVGIFSYNSISWYIYSVVFGFASGFFAVIFLFTVWGDLSPQGKREKYYALGSLPYFLIGFVSKLSAPYAAAISINASFSLASFFLFLAIIPLIYAPETLPEKLIRRRELRRYVEKAKKIREKYEKKGT